MSGAEQARIVARRAAESAALVSKQLAFGQFARQGGGIQRDKAGAERSTAFMNRARHQFLAGTALPNNEKGAARARGGFDACVQLAHQATGSHQAVKAGPGIDWDAPGFALQRIDSRIGPRGLNARIGFGQQRDAQMAPLGDQVLDLERPRMLGKDAGITPPLEEHKRQHFVKRDPTGGKFLAQARNPLCERIVAVLHQVAGPLRHFRSEQMEGFDRRLGPGLTHLSGIQLHHAVRQVFL